MTRDEACRILGISKTATPQEIKSAYRKRALATHPDKNPHDGARELFRLIQDAYDTLIKVVNAEREAVNARARRARREAEAKAKREATERSRQKEEFLRGWREAVGRAREMEKSHPSHGRSFTELTEAQDKERRAWDKLAQEFNRVWRGDKKEVWREIANTWRIHAETWRKSVEHWKNHEAYHDGMAKIWKQAASYCITDDSTEFLDIALGKAESHLASAREAENSAWSIQNSYRPLGRAKQNARIADRRASLGHSMIENGRFVAVPHYWEEYEFLTIRKDRPPWSWFTTKAKIPWFMLLDAEHSWWERENDFRSASKEINKLWESQEMEAGSKK